MRSCMRKIKRLLHLLDESLTGLGSKLEGRQIRFYPTLIGPIFFLALGIAGFVIMPSQVRIQENQATTARTFPSLMLGVIVIGSIFLLVQEVIKLLRKQPMQVIQLELLTEIRAIVILGLLILYAVLMPVLGFIVTSTLFGIGMLLFFRIKKFSYFLIVAIAALTIGLLFQMVLNVRLP